MEFYESNFDKEILIEEFILQNVHTLFFFIDEKCVLEYYDRQSIITVFVSFSKFSFSSNLNYCLFNSVMPQVVWYWIELQDLLVKKKEEKHLKLREKKKTLTIFKTIVQKRIK